MDLQNADLFAACIQIIDSLLGGFRAGTHHHDHALGIRCTDVIEQVVLAADDLGELVHDVLHDRGASQIVRINCFASLEIHIRVLGSAAQHWLVG